MLIIDLFIIVCLAFVFIQDIKQRQISWILIPLTLGGFIYKATVYGNDFFKDVLFNTVFVVVQIVLLTIYMSIKNKKPVNIINTYLGLGDVLFFLVLCAAFSPLNFIVFYLFSILITIIGVLIHYVFTKKQIKEIPLAGAMAGALIVLMIVNSIIPAINLYNDDFLLSVISIL